MQKYANLVDLVKSFPKIIYLQKSASIQPRTTPSQFGEKFNSIFNRVLRGGRIAREVVLTVSDAHDQRGALTWLKRLRRESTEIRGGKKTKMLTRLGFRAENLYVAFLASGFS